MKASIKVEAQLITQLEKEGSHSNFVSGPLRLEYDEIISELLVDDMSEERTYKNGKPTIVPI